VTDGREQLERILQERIAVLDGSWGVERGETHGSPTHPLLSRSALHGRLDGLSPGKARLRPREALAEENG
jgi:hypothetical protein